jgi:uncharacterized delta-60 repeat protein
LLAASGLAFMLHATYAQAAPADLDPSFSRDGKQGIDFGTSFSRDDGAVLDVEQLADGTTMVVATSRTNIYQDQNMNIVIARLAEDGSLDTSYSGDGRQDVDPPGEQSWRGASIQPDGSVAVAGELGSYAVPPRDFVVARIQPDGVLDPSFAGDGVQEIGFGPESDDGATAVVQHPDGKVVVGGFAEGNPGGFAIARLRQDGELDSGFSADGRATVGFADRSGLNDLALSESGDVVAVGSVGFTPFLDLAVARLRRDGSPDPTFGDGGAERLDLGPDDEVCGGEAGQSVAVQSDGLIVIGGVSSFGCSIGPGANRHAPLLVRLEQDGDVDRSFPVLTGLPVPDVDDVAVHPTGILGVGSSGQNWFPLRDFVLFRRQLDGAPDGSFPRPDGSVATNFDGRKDEASALSVQGDGSVLVAGVLLTDSPDARVGIARYLMDQGRRDQDADGIRDKPDRCARGFAKRRRGCPRLKDDGILRLAVDDEDGSFDGGYLSLNYAECMDRRRVLILKPRPGKDRVVRSTKAEYDQEFGDAGFSANLKPGRYYAKAPRSVEAVGICRALNSDVVRIRK